MVKNMKERQKLDWRNTCTFRNAPYGKSTIIKVKNALGYIQGEGKDRKFLNDVVHNTSYAEPTASHLESIAADVKEVIQIILNDEE